jgi:hypothetical protein
MALAQATQRIDVLFQAQVLAVLLDWRQGRTSLDANREALLKLLQSYPDPEQQAALYFALWEIDPGDEPARQQAMDLYHQRYQRAGFYEDRQRYQQLTGELLPQRHQAPPLPAFLLHDPDRDVLELIETIPTLMD